MHYTGTIWRPPYEASSLLLEVTAGCTHHRCKFCTLYDELPFAFRMSPMEVIEADLTEAQMLYHAPDAKLERALTGRPAHKIERVYLTGANPFVLSKRRLAEIAGRIHEHLPACKTIGCFARITDVSIKSDGDLRELHDCGYDGLTIGVETGDDAALAFMDKGYEAKDIVTQCARLDAVGIGYHFFYLAGISGAGHGEDGASASARVFNQTHPKRIGSSMLTVFPESRLYQEIQNGAWQEESELEKVREVRTLISELEIPAYFATLGASNAIWVQGQLPREKEKLLAQLEAAAQRLGEETLRDYRVKLRHL